MKFNTQKALRFVAIIKTLWRSERFEVSLCFSPLLPRQLRHNTSISTFNFVRNNSGGKSKTRSLLASLATSGGLITVRFESWNEDRDVMEAEVELGEI